MPSRPTFGFPPLDPASLKDVARSLRFVVGQGGRRLKHSLPRDVLPDPAARLVDGPLAQALRLGESAVSGIAHALLDRDDPPPPLTEPSADAAEERFAAVAHDGLRATLAHLGAADSLIHETAIRQAWRQVFATGNVAHEGQTAAALFLALEQAKAIRDTLWPEDATLPLAEARRIALFAVLLAMLDSAADFTGRLAAAVDIALALRADLVIATDRAALAALFDEFRDHV